MLARRRRTANVVGAIAAVGFVLVMAAGADRPPPPGFVVVLLAGVVLWLATRRILPIVLADWDVRGAGRALLRVGLGGFVVAAAAWTVVSMVSPGEPSVTVDLGSRVLGAAIVGVVGMLGCLALAGVGRALDRRPQR